MAKRTKKDEAKARPEETCEPELTKSQKTALSGAKDKDKIRTLEELRAKRAKEKEDKRDKKISEMKDNRKKSKENRNKVIEPKKIYKKIDGFTISDVLAMNDLFAKSLRELRGKPHHLIGYTLGKIKPILREYNATLAEHEDYDKYTEAHAAAKRDLRGRILREEAERLAKEYPSYLAYVRDLGEDMTDLEVRQFPSEWVDQMEGVAELTIAISEFGLWDDPDAMADRLFEEDNE